MGYKNLGQCVADLEAHGHLRRIDIPVDPNLEMAAIQRMAFRKGAPALLFTRPKGSSFPMLANLFGTRERVRHIFRDSLATVESIFKAKADPAWVLRNPAKAARLLPGMPRMLPARARRAPVLDNTCAKSQLPGLVSWPGDGGAFITLPLVYSEHPDKKRHANLGMYRIQLSGNEYGEDEAGLHYQLQRGIGIHHAAALAGGKKLPVHVYAGGSPALILSAVMPMPEGMSELMFAGILGGRRIGLARPKGFSLPVLGECDFMLKGHVASGLKPEGPFGDHLGYYSLRHDFPVLRIEKIFHRDDAIWPFTSVGRPPQEDTILGEFIHEFTAPLVPQVFAGVREVHAVDAAGVHPLLLAMGEERYMPWHDRRKPAELLTHAMHLLGVTQTAQAKFLLIAENAPGLTVRDARAFISHVLERSDFSENLHFLTRATCDTLDYSGSALHEGSKLIWAVCGPKRRDLGHETGEMPPLPSGFGNVRMASPGIAVIGGPAHKMPRGCPDPAIEELLAPALASWPRRESFPFVIIADDPDFCAASFDNLLWVAFTRADPATDTYGVNAATQAKHWSCQAPLILDARKKGFHAPPLEDDPAIIRKIMELAKKGAPLEGLIDE